MRELLKNDEKRRNTIKPELLDDLRYYDIEDISVKSNKEKGFILTGEHPREMIAPEVVLKFMQDLCKKGTPENK